MEQLNKSQGSAPNEREILESIIKQLQLMLPEDWSVRELPSPVEIDALIEMASPDNRTAKILVEVKSLLSPRDVPMVLGQLGLFEAGVDGILLGTRYISPSTRRTLEKSKTNYVDSTGNMSITISSPAIVLRAQGANKDPYRGPQRRTSSLKGEPASRVARALIDCRPPWKMRELADAAGTSLASTSRTVDFLDRESLIQRKEGGSIIDADWEGILRRWAEDYELTRNRGKVTGLIAPRGLDVVVSDLSTYMSPYALSGSIAAQPWVPYAEPRSGLIYAPDTQLLAASLGAREAQARANLIVIEPKDDLPFLRQIEKDGLRYVAMSQIAVDLLAGPGRNPEEGLALIEWMRRSESEWRKQ